MPLLHEPESKKYRFLLYVEQNYSFDILRPIQKHAKLLGHDIRWLLVGKDVSSHFLLDDEVLCTSIESAVKFEPDAVFVPGNKVPAFISGIKVQVFHGLNQSKRGNVYPERGLFDLYCTEGPGRTSSLQSLAKNKEYFKVVETGWVKLDSLFAQTNHLLVEKQSKTKPHILFASTFSPSLSCAELVYEQIKQLSQTGEWHWLVTLHPKMIKETVVKYRQLESENLTFFYNDKVIDMMHLADVMVCDNSSIFQEFLLLNKPVVTVNNRDVQASFINITNPEKLKPAIEMALSPTEKLMTEINKYGSNITPYLDGESAPRILDAVIEMLQSNWKNNKPKNWFRNFKIRKSLGYWKF
ncbi:CDP-glycerol glycerophosphotransferase family protein [Vibrio sp. MA40-2]|uniref:CDP-glycerol glycerophosphotransferase family protein n=1 Tax=Vibrio sp. MA40-2 TaxID=3391828 RepID=UPI0039A75E24